MKTNPLNLSSVFTAIALAAGGVLAQQVPPGYGHDFVTIGAPGNRDALREEWPIFYDTSPDQNIGGVAYEFRISRSEVAASQWIDFAEAFRPFKNSLPEYELEAGVLSWSGNGYSYNLPFYATRGATPSFHLAARYCNWLHNGKVNEAWAFATGAYDVSLFDALPDGSYPTQTTRMAGARYWVPSFDESIKAFYFDTNRYGPGQDGYWPFVNMSLTLPTPGVTTNAATNDSLRYGLGLFPNAQSPWGLLDTSGGVSEMTESFAPMNEGSLRRRSLGSDYGAGSNFDIYDRLDSRHSTYDSRFTLHGFRVASVIPSPTVGATAGITFALFVFRRKRECTLAK